jgi:hypothetical protein
MKLVLQIAGGIVLGVLIIWGVRLAIASYETHQLNEQLKASLQNFQQQELQLQHKLDERRQQQLKAQQDKDRNEVMSDLKIMKQRDQDAATAQAQATEKAKMDQAFAKWWQPPDWCDNPEDTKMLIHCADLKMRKRSEFDKLWAAGRIQQATPVK